MRSVVPSKPCTDLMIDWIDPLENETGRIVDWIDPIENETDLNIDC